MKRYKKMPRTILSATQFTKSVSNTPVHEYFDSQWLFSTNLNAGFSALLTQFNVPLSINRGTFAFFKRETRALSVSTRVHGLATTSITTKAKGTKCPVCWKINEGPCPRHP